VHRVQDDEHYPEHPKHEGWQPQVALEVIYHRQQFNCFQHAQEFEEPQRLDHADDFQCLCLAVFCIRMRASDV
jgi:hypothetical protein